MTSETPAGIQLDINEITKILPHRYPFLLVDRVEELLPGPKAESRMGRKFRCVKNVTVNEPFFPGHFPGNPVMPGVLIVEAMAQASALACYNEKDGQQDFFLAAVREAKFRRKVVPGDTLEMVGEITRDGGSMIIAKVSTHVRGQVVAEAEIMAKIFPRTTA